MKFHRDEKTGERGPTHGPGFGGLLRSLFTRMPWEERASHEEILVVPAPSGRSVRVHNANGKTRVVGEDRDDIEIRVHKSVRADCPELAAKLLDSIRLDNSETPEVLEIEVQIPRKCSRHAVAHIELHVPRDTTVALSTTNGKICLEGLDRPVRARSSNGSVSISDIEGDIDVTTANAKVTCHGTHGHLRARSSNGKIELGEHQGSIDASTSNGIIRASLDALGEIGVTLTTSNGRIVLDLPEQADADIDIRVDNGFIRNDLELQDQTGESTDRIRGRLGKGGIPIKLRTSNGTVSLR
jgi:HSP20 family molecular chaperone IbpA